MQSLKYVKLENSVVHVTVGTILIQKRKYSIGRANSAE